MRRASVMAWVLASAALALAGCGGGGSNAPPANSSPKLPAERFQTPEEAGPNPFTPSVDVSGRRTVSLPETEAQPFGGSGSNHVCDRNKLIRFLATHRSRMLFWASVLHVQPNLAAVKRYIAKLHPVTLTRDTRVTNHGFTEAQGAVAFQAILQAGTSVLVDRYGRPVVRCFCGNPLGPPVAAAAKTRCINCPAHYSPPKQCEFGRADDYDALYYRRSYYDNASYDGVFIRLQRRSRFRGCYVAYPEPPTVTVVNVYRPPPEPVAPPATGQPQTGGGLHCNPPRSQLEFEQCSAQGQPQTSGGLQCNPPRSQLESEQCAARNQSPAAPQQPSRPQTPPSQEPAPNLPQVGECNNGVDDDGDGLVDTADPGCSGPNDQSE